MNKVEKLCSKRKLSLKTIKYLIKKNIIREWNKYKIGINIYINKIFNKYIDILDEKDIAISKTLIKIDKNKIYIRTEIPKLDIGYNKVWYKFLPFFIPTAKFNPIPLSIIDQFHEAMEIKYSVDFIKLYHFVKKDMFKCIDKNGKEYISYHFGPKVLQEEHKIVNYGSLFDPNIEALRQYRIWRGDYSSKIIKLSNSTLNKYNKILSNRLSNKSWLYQHYVLS